MARKIPDALVAQAAELVKAGSDLKTAASRIGCTADELSKKLRAIGVSPSTKTDWNSRSAKIIELYQSGLGTTAIALHFGAKRPAAGNVRDVLMRNSIPIRGKGEAMSVRMKRLNAAERISLVSSARAVRSGNMVSAAASGESNAAIGFGETELASVLTGGGIDVAKQVVFADNYFIDLVVDQIAVEVKTSSISAHMSKGTDERFKKLRECGYSLIFVVVNHLPTLLRHADDFIAIFKLAQRHPPGPGEYWVVRCTLEQIGAHTEVDHWSVERRSPKTE